MTTPRPAEAIPVLGQHGEFADLTAVVSTAERAAVFGGNAVAAYRLRI